MKIIERYIARELLLPFVVVITILAGLFASFSGARLLAQGLTESLGMAAMLKLVSLRTLVALDVLIPVALYVAIIIGLGRLYRDQEINVLRSAGVSDYRIYTIILLITLPVGILSGALSLFARPWAYEESFILNAQAEADLNTNRFQAGRFYGSEGSGRVIYIQAKDNDGYDMKEIFHFTRKPDSSEVVVAKKAQRQESQSGQRPQIHLFDGYIYKLARPGLGEVKDTIIRFEKLVYYTDGSKALEYRRKAATTATLMESDKPRDIAELQWRISRPFSAILLAMIAIPFSRAAPRQDKGTRNYVAAAGVFAIYYNLGGLAQIWVEQGVVKSFPGIWWLYVLMAMIVVSVLLPGSWQKVLRRR